MTFENLWNCCSRRPSMVEFTPGASFLGEAVSQLFLGWLYINILTSLARDLGYYLLPQVQINLFLSQFNSADQRHSSFHQCQKRPDVWQTAEGSNFLTDAKCDGFSGSIRVPLAILKLLRSAMGLFLLWYPSTSISHQVYIKPTGYTNFAPLCYWDVSI